MGATVPFRAYTETSSSTDFVSLPQRPVMRSGYWPTGTPFVSTVRVSCVMVTVMPLGAARTSSVSAGRDSVSFTREGAGDVSGMASSGYARTKVTAGCTWFCGGCTSRGVPPGT